MRPFLSSKKKKEEKLITMHTHTQTPPTSKQRYMSVLYSYLYSIFNFLPILRPKIGKRPLTNTFYRKKNGDSALFHSNHISRTLHCLSFFGAVYHSQQQSPHSSCAYTIMHVQFIKYLHPLPLFCFGKQNKDKP